MNNSETLERINEIIIDEKGLEVTMDGMFLDAKLDSLGTTIALITIDSEFHIFNPYKVNEDLSDLNLTTLTVKDLVMKCRLSAINTSMEHEE